MPIRRKLKKPVKRRVLIPDTDSATGIYFGDAHKHNHLAMGLHPALSPHVIQSTRPQLASGDTANVPNAVPVEQEPSPVGLLASLIRPQ